ncbi:MAG TPA: acetyltransferase [Clostridiaceae bacterium]|jgi:sugar O-acyltransferase (sialic acid O-acetyltransferase NeuD family)|nr:acetyltransferase [Clostridiaceae bacterium]HRV29161.1 acetyltransferase [Spirochaetia bacterium]
MCKNLVIIGAGGHGKVVADIATKMKCWDSIRFLDDNKSITNCLGFDVVGQISDAIKYRDCSDFFVAIGNNNIREKIQEDLIRRGFKIAILLHPSAIIGTSVDIGIGTAIMAGAIINSSSKIGNGCIINTNSSLDHDNVVGDYVHVSPGVKTGGNINIGRLTWLGIGSVVSNSISICSSCKTGAGAVVVRDITEPGTYVGVPVRRIVSDENSDSSKF